MFSVESNLHRELMNALENDLKEYLPILVNMIVDRTLNILNRNPADELTDVDNNFTFMARHMMTAITQHKENEVTSEHLASKIIEESLASLSMPQLYAVIGFVMDHVLTENGKNGFIAQLINTSEDDLDRCKC